MSEDLARRWVAAWVAARALDVAELHGWPVVHVGSASREHEAVCCEPTAEAWTGLLDWAGGDRSRMLTLVAQDPERYVADLPLDIRVDRVDETLMTRTIEAPEQRPVPDGFALEVEDLGTRVKVRLVDGDREAAAGTVGVHGTDAAYDAVETTPRYQRRGLGSWVMSRLDAHAVDLGATTGLLVATPDGAALYRSLGWSAVSPMRSVMGA